MKDNFSIKHNPIVKRIFLAMLAPTILMNLTTAIGSVADTIIIGQYLDDLSLSVVTFATPIYMIINTFAALFAIGGCVSMSVDAGKGDKNSANRAFSMAMELLCFTGLLLLISGLFFSNPITHCLGADAAVFDKVEEYSRIILLGGPLFVLNIGLAFFVRNDGRPNLSMIGMFSSIAIDITLNFVFVGGMGMGVSGAAYSTVIGQIVSILIVSTHFFSSKNTLKFKPVFNKNLWRITKNGISSSLHFVYQFLIILIMNHFLTKIAGPNGVVIYTVIFNLSTVSLSVFEGISQTIQPMISNYYGERSYKNIKETLRLSINTIFAICGSVTVFLELFPQLIPIAFGVDDLFLIEQSSTAVRIFATSMVIMTFNVVLGYYLQSTEQTFISSLFVSLRCFIVLLCATFALGLIFNLNGIWAAYTVAEVVSLLIISVLIHIKRKKSCTEINILLLESSVESGIYCLTFRCKTANDYNTFISSVLEAAKKANLNPEKCNITVNLLNKFKDFLKNDKFIEVEINSIDQKVIIRDNLKYEAFDCDAEFSPVLGWNRVCV